MDQKSNILFVDGREVAFSDERNLLEVIRSAGVDIPTFCYHSELSIYGACRLCLVEIEGRGLQASCSIKPEPGLKVKTSTKQIRNMRKVNVELLLASHRPHCTTCDKSGQCGLQSLAKKLGVTNIRYKATSEEKPLDTSSPSIVRDPNKCVLCGDCVRFCSEIQSVGAIDFAFRGSKAAVIPAFGKDFSQVECVNCGQCARVCPTGALVPKSEIDAVFSKLDNPKKIVIAQIAPAIRVALGEYFGLAAGTINTGQIVAALKRLGFDRVYDTSFTADLTVVEEATEFIERFTKGEHLPQFTSCCPAWVKFAEQYYPELLRNVSTCRSPQQMFGSLAKNVLPDQLAVKREDLVVVSVMPCTAKKFEAKRDEFITQGLYDVDHVITTQELGRMIEQAGIRFTDLEAESFDLPFSFKTGAGVIFGSSGGVTEAALRFAAEKVNGVKLDNPNFYELRTNEPLRVYETVLAGKKVKCAVVYGLAEARKIADAVREGTCDYSLIEVMACPGGCINGAGQPVTSDTCTVLARKKSLYTIDKTLELHKSQDNPYIAETYSAHLGKAGGHTAHELLHTTYYSRRRIEKDGLTLMNGSHDDKVEIGVCLGTSCFVKGSQDLLRALMVHVEKRGLADYVDVKASFCFEGCREAPVVRINGTLLNAATFKKAADALDAELAQRGIAVSSK